MTNKHCPPHYCDNQGTCHYCGLLMEPAWWDLYVNGPPSAKKAGGRTQKAARTQTKKGKRT